MTLTQFPCHPFRFRDLSEYQVLLGVTQLSNPGPKACCLGVKQIIVNPTYAGQTTSGDIALVQLSRKVHYSDLILPICLPDASVKFPPGKLCWVTGWGNLRHSGMSRRQKAWGGGNSREEALTDRDN